MSDLQLENGRSTEFIRAKQQLKQGDANVYDHLTNVLMDVIKTGDGNLVGFEALSLSKKKQTPTPTPTPTSDSSETQRERIAKHTNFVRFQLPRQYGNSEYAGFNERNVKRRWKGDTEQQQDDGYSDYDGSSAPSGTDSSAGSEVVQEEVSEPTDPLDEVEYNDVDPENELEDVENYQLPDLQAQFRLLQWAGVAVAHTDTQSCPTDQGLKLYLAVQQLCNYLREDVGEPIEVRYFGTFFGTERDYYVVEVRLDNPDLEPEEQDLDEDDPRELSGNGANQYAYYVINSVEINNNQLLKDPVFGGEQKKGKNTYSRSDNQARGGGWVRLPNVTPEQIVTARRVKRFLTGRLSAPVKGFPRFPWGEASLLRAQIARIAASTVVSPKDKYIRGEGWDRYDQSLQALLEEVVCTRESKSAEGQKKPTKVTGYYESLFADAREKYENIVSGVDPFGFAEDLIPNDEEPMDGDEPAPEKLDLSQLDSWAHVRRPLLQIGRMAPLESAEDDYDGGYDDEESEEQLKAQRLAKWAKTEVLVPPLRTLAFDELSPLAHVRTSKKSKGGPRAPWSVTVARETVGLTPEGTVSRKQTVVLRSQLWPGAVSVSDGNETVSVYVGYGHKFQTNSYRPPPPPSFQQEYVPDVKFVASKMPKQPAKPQEESKTEEGSDEKPAGDVVPTLTAQECLEEQADPVLSNELAAWKQSQEATEEGEAEIDETGLVSEYEDETGYDDM